MIKKWSLLSLFILCSLLLTGCWDRRELNELAIGVALGIDKAGNQYKVSAQIVNPGELAAKKGGGKSPVVTYQAEGSTVLEALRKMTTESPRRLYGAHLLVVVIGEQVAKEGIAKPLDLLSRDPEMRPDFFIVVSKEDTAEEILGHLTTLEKIPANHLYRSLEMSEKSWAGTGKTTMDVLVSDLISNGTEPVLTGITLERSGKKKEEVKSAVFQYKNMAVFKKDKLVGWLNEQESKGFNYAKGQVKSTVVTVACPNKGTLGVKLIRTKAVIKGKVENEQPSISIDFSAEGDVAEVDCSLDMTKQTTLSDIEKRVNDDITDKIKAAVYKAQKSYNSDIFGFGEAIHRADFRAWKEMQKEWYTHFSEVPVNINVNVDIRNMETVTDSLEKSMEGAE